MVKHFNSANTMKKLLLIILLFPVICKAQDFTFKPDYKVVCASIIVFDRIVNGKTKLPDVNIQMSSYECENGFDVDRFYKDVDLAEQHTMKYYQRISFDIPMDGKEHHYKVPLLQYILDPKHR